MSPLSDPVNSRKILVIQGKSCPFPKGTRLEFEAIRAQEIQLFL